MALLISGCGIFNPYQNAVVVPTDADAPLGLELAGGAEDALRHAEDMRLGYYEKLQWSAYGRSAAAVGAVGLTGWALYNALKPTDTGVAYVGDTRRSVRLGAGLGGLYGLRQFFLNPAQEKIDAEAYHALTCLMYQTSPLLLTQASTSRSSALPPDPSRRGGSTWQSALVPVAENQPRGWGDVERLEQDMLLLRAKILEVWKLVDRYDAKVDSIGGNSKEVRSVNRYFRDRSSETKVALRYANNALFDAGNLLDATKRVGNKIETHVGLVVARANAAIQGKQNDLPDGNALLKSSQSLTSGIKSIGVDTQADQADVKAAASAGQQVSDAGISVDRMRAVQWRQMTGTVRMTRVAAAATDLAPPGSSSTTPTHPAGITRTAVTKPKKTHGKAPPATAIASAERLKEIRKQLVAAIAGIEKSEADRKQKESADVLERARLDLRNAYYTKAEEALLCKPGASRDDACLDNLLVQKEELYALRRPLVQALSNLQERVRRSADSPECAELATLRVAPTDPARVAAGTTLEYLVTQNSEGENPTAVLQGPVQDDTGASLKVEAIGATKTFKVILKLGAQMTTQRIRVIVSDSRQLSTHILIVNVIGFCKPPAAGEEAADRDCKPPPATPSIPKTTTS